VNPYRSFRGVALLDVIFTCGLIAIVAAIAIPSLHASRERTAPLLAARFLAGKLNMLRIEAVRRNQVVAMRLDPDDLGKYATYVDGDGDGVRQRDIEDAIDPAIESEAHVAHYFALAAVKVPLPVPGPDGDMIEASSDPIRIGSTNFLSFSPTGASTSGTIYLAGADGTQVCVRVFGGTGRVRVLWFDRARRTWRQG
jgi:type II secretory pathway pseudopilin PulG